MSSDRNKPCPCGSGKKFKKCCINKEAQQEENEWQQWFKKDCEEGDQLLHEYEEELQKRLQAHNHFIPTQENNRLLVQEAV